MTQNQLMDSLTSHISLYHSTSDPFNRDSNSNPNPRSSILKWFSSLTLHQRQAHLTVVDFKFVQILIQMVAELRRRGHGFFILLPDIPSSDPPHLPSLCFKKSRGLLSRVSELSESEKMIFESSRLFGSREGDKLEECSCSLKNIDSLTVSEDFVANVDKFVEVMDGVSNGGFLRGEGGDLASDWAELNWLKAKGYYSIEAFVANKLEVALRLSWMNLNNGKKRSVKFKEKASATGMATNVFWRKKGCVDWWEKLDAPSRKKIFTTILGKSAKNLVHGHIMSVGKDQGPTRKKKKHKSKISGGNNKLVEIRPSEGPTVKFSSPSLNSQDRVAELENIFRKPSISNIKKDSSDNYDNSTLNSSPEPNREYGNSQNIEVHEVSGLTKSVCQISSGESQFPKRINENQRLSSTLETSTSFMDCSAVSSHLPSLELKNIVKSDVNVKGSVQTCELGDKSSSLDKLPRTFNVKEKSYLSRDQFNGDTCSTRTLNSHSPYEWHGVASLYIPSFNTHLPPATDRLHLDVGHNWHNHFRRSFTPAMHQSRNSSVKGGCSPILTRPLLMSLDWPPVLRSASGLASTMTSNHDTGFLSKRQSTFRQGFPTNNNQISTDDEKYSGKLIDFPDLSINQDLADECDGNWISEEELEMHAVSGIDYNQYFGGGVMYWNPSDHHGTGFSRPPSLSSDDSSWAWREADMNRTVDDMVAFSSSYSNGLTSPTATSFCSPFDPLGSGKQALGYVVQGNDLPNNMLHSSPTMKDTVTEEDAPRSLANLPSEVEGKTGDLHPFPMLRPIVIPNMSRERSRSEFCHGYDRNSPCIPPTRREQSRVKRPPSPVVLCVPRSPIPPPPSPVSDSRKHRGFPTVRSGSSSPRHWGVKSWYPDGTNLEEACLRIDGAEVVWPNWRNKSNSNCSAVQPLSLIAMPQIALDQEHPDVAFPLFPPTMSCTVKKESLSFMHSRLHDEINLFCKHVAAENMAKKPYITWAVKRVTRSLQVLWPRSRTNIFGSNATGLSLPTSDVDLVVCLPPVRNLEPIKEAGILEGRNGIKETCLQHAARYLSNQEWVKSDSLKTVENTAIPIIMLVVEVPHDLITSSTSNMQSPKEESSAVSGEQDVNILNDMASVEDSALPKCLEVNYDSSISTKSVRIDISFKTPSHTGLQTSELVKELTAQFPATIPLALVLKNFLADRSLDQSYSGGLSSYCLVLLIIRFLQHVHHLGRPINQNFGGLLMDFLYFFGNVFDPRQMRISIQGSGVYIKRERGYSIDPLHIDDPLFPMNNIGRNCFRIHQCIKAFSEAYSILESELISLHDNGDTSSDATNRVLQKIIPSIQLS